MDLSTLTIKDARKKLANKEFSSVELTKAYLDRIHMLDSKLNAFITVTGKEALQQAEAADKRIKEFEITPLLGIPVALKDIYVTKGIRTTAASKVLENYIPQYEATSVKKLKKAGAVIIGKTNHDAWAHGSSGENSQFGPTKNPYNLEFVPGGSSSGSPVALRADMCLASSGTDTGGSIRLPANFCNLVGLKPTYGRVSRYGIIAMASSLDTVGHFTKTVTDNAMYLQVTAGNDGNDATTPNKPIPNYTKKIASGIKGLKIGMPREYFADGVDPRVKEKVLDALKVYERLGSEIIDISLPYTEYVIAVYYIVQTAEVSSNLARYDGVRFGNLRETFGDEAKRRIMLGTYVLSSGYYDAYYEKAMRVRTLLKKDFNDAWKKVNVIIAPVSPTPAWKIGEKVDDPLKMYLSDIFAASANLTGIPGLAVPVGFIERLPIGMQILGPHFSEDLLYRFGYAYEQEHPWWKTKPDL